MWSRTPQDSTKSSLFQRAQWPSLHRGCNTYMKKIHHFIQRFVLHYAQLFRFWEMFIEETNSGNLSGKYNIKQTTKSLVSHL